MVQVFSLNSYTVIQEELPDYSTVENRNEAKPPTPDDPPNYSTPVPKSSKSKKAKSNKVCIN